MVEITCTNIVMLRAQGDQKVKLGFLVFKDLQDWRYEFKIWSEMICCTIMKHKLSHQFIVSFEREKKGSQAIP